MVCSPTLAEVLLQSSSLDSSGAGRACPRPLSQYWPLRSYPADRGQQPGSRSSRTASMARTSQILLGPPGDTRGTWLLDAGSLHGVRPGTVLVVYPPAGTADAHRQVGHVRVVQVEPLAVVEPVAFGDLPAPTADTLVPRSRCQVIFVDYGDLRLTVAMQAQADPSAELQTLAPGQGPPSLEAAFTALMAQPGHLVERVADPTDAAWYVRVVADEVYLVPASGWHRPADQGTDDRPSQAIAPPQFALGPVAAGNSTGSLAGGPDPHRPRTTPPEPDHRGRVERQCGGHGRCAPRHVALPSARCPQGAVVPYDQEGRVLRPGEIVAFRVTNPAPVEVDVTLLFISSTYGIKTLFPPHG